MAAFEDPRELGFDPELVKTALMSREQFGSKPRKLILGIDMGIADIGICLMDELNQEIVLMATHLFDCPWIPKTKTSLASARRQARSQRRNIARRAARKKHIREILMAHGVIPEDATAEWFSVRKGDQDNIQLRVKGLSEILDGRELARVLYGFASRRGYIDHGKADNDKDAGKVKKALKANAEIMEANVYETFAQYLITQPRIRNRQDDYTHCVDLDMVVDEVHTIFRHQRELGNGLATEVAAGCERAQARAVVLGDEDAVEDAFAGADLVGAHHEQRVGDVEHAVVREHHEQRALGEEGSGERHQVGDAAVGGVRPPARELVGGRGLLF